MGQVMSLEELEECVRINFCDQVLLLLSHGLFRLPSAHGTHVKLEVDLAELPFTTGRKENYAELVVQIVKEVGFSFGKRKDDETVNHGENGIEFQGVWMEKDLNNVDRLKHFTPSDGSKGVLNASTLSTRDVNDISDNVELEVLELISELAPNVTFQNASFDAILNVFQELYAMNRENNAEFSSEFIQGMKRVPHKPVKIEELVLSQNKKRKISHANIVPTLGVCRGDGLLFIFYPPAPFTLESILNFSPNTFSDDWDIRFLVYQIFSAMAFCHGQGIIHGDLKPSNILLTDMLWCWITGFHVGSMKSRRTRDAHHEVLHQDLCQDSDSENWHSAFKMWWQGDLSNYDYLLILNKIAGRRWGDRKFHTVMPWIIDFSIRPDETSVQGWRDLTKSKWRLAKGDEQLDFMYSTAEIPHHVSDECLSELAVCIYKARRLPLFVLRQTVRSVYEPNEYPVSLQRLYQWTPDECIPEFFSDAAVFSSVHAGMTDLALPPWSQNAEEFIFLHRAALEGEHVSRQLHHWIDLTFGYKLSGEAAVDAKNVALSTTNSSTPRSQGRRQLFNLPHPQRQRGTRHVYDQKNLKQIGLVNSDLRKDPADCATAENIGSFKNDGTCCANLDHLEHATVFCEKSRHLSPNYLLDIPSISSTEAIPTNNFPCKIKEIVESSQECLVNTFQALKAVDESEGTYQDHVLWEKMEMHATISFGEACDIFSLGCIIAEIYLKEPLFDPVSLRDFNDHGIEPSLLQRLPFPIQSFVRPMIEKNPTRKLSLAQLLGSPFFPPTVRAVHTFVSILYHHEDKCSRLQLVASLARHNAFLLMGPMAAKKCISFCLSPLVLPHEDIPVQAFIIFMNASLKALKPYDSNVLVLPAIQKLLQGQGNSDVKVALLQASFIRNIFKSLGITMYLQYLHHAVLFSIQQPIGNGPVNAAASNLLIEISQDLGVPVTCSQIIAPLLQNFGRDVTTSVIDTVVGIGKQLGEQMLVKHLILPLRAMITACMHSIFKENKAPARTWRMLVMRDSAIVLEHLLDFLSPTTVLMELVQEPHNVLEGLLLHPEVTNSLQQCAAKVLISVCRCIGPDATVAYVLPRLQTLFAFDAFSTSKYNLEMRLSDHTNTGSSSDHAELSNNQGVMEPAANMRSQDFITDEKLKAQMDILHILYKGLSFFLGIERLRQCVNTSHRLEELLAKLYSWKWEKDNNTFHGKSERVVIIKEQQLKSGSELSSTRFLLNEIGWSVPQPFLSKIKPLYGENNSKQVKAKDDGSLCETEAPWTWVPRNKDAGDCTDYVNRTGLVFGGGKDDQPWKLKMTTCHSWRAHPGPLKAIAVGDGEATIFTAGVGTKMRGLIKQWKLSTTQDIMEYTGHEEAVNDICVIPWANKGVSCDGTIHMWDTRTGDRVVLFSEYNNQSSSQLFGSSLVETNRLQSAVSIGTSGTALSSGMLSTGLHGNQYTCMHLMECEDTLVAGTGNGYVRFFDLPSGRSLHLWQCDLELSGSSLVSAIASSGSNHHISGRTDASSWISMGFGLGQCRLLDLRSGNFVSSWKAHDNFITKLSAFDDHYLISSSLDKTICVWDVRRTAPVQVRAFQGHNNGVSSFVIWSKNLLSAGGNRIGLSSLSQPLIQGQNLQSINCHKLFSTDLSNLNLSSITAIDVLPFSRFFVAATDDGFLRVCR